MKNDPNGYDWHEPRCPTCKRFDADCDCDPQADAEIEWARSQLGLPPRKDES